MEKLIHNDDRRVWSRWKPRRWIKTIFFLLTMLSSLLLDCSPPLLIILLDLVFPSALLFSSSQLHHLKYFDFNSSLIDIPFISLARSFLIFCVYTACSGRGAYLALTSTCSFASALYVLLKAVRVFAMKAEWHARLAEAGKDVEVAVAAMFLTSLALAAAHIVVAYRTSCREQRKMIVCRIDIEAVKLNGGQLKSGKWSAS